MTYTCTDYRLEMQLLALQRQLMSEQLSTDDKEALKDQIRELEQRMGMGNEDTK